MSPSSGPGQHSRCFKEDRSYGRDLCRRGPPPVSRTSKLSTTPADTRPQARKAPQPGLDEPIPTVWAPPSRYSRQGGDATTHLHRTAIIFRIAQRAVAQQPFFFFFFLNFLLRRQQTISRRARNGKLKSIVKRGLDMRGAGSIGFVSLCSTLNVVSCWIPDLAEN